VNEKEREQERKKGREGEGREEERGGEMDCDGERGVRKMEGEMKGRVSSFLLCKLIRRERVAWPGRERERE
jgi:hypothetical protein